MWHGCTIERTTKMRVSKEKMQKNHERIVQIASELFRERGFDGVGVAELMECAGLTHGGFYNHFRSKDNLIAEATAKGFEEIAELYADQGTLDAIELYISREHRDSRGQGCPAAALSCEVARQSDQTKTVFAAGIENRLRKVGDELGHYFGVEARAKAISIVAQAVGAIILSRACPDDSALAEEILEVCRADCHAAIESSVRRQGRSVASTSSPRRRRSK
jgi:TetR/AcrR family transcriptional repressor of nem operon